MESQITTALSLLGIGMVTVFLVLFLVVSSGNLLIILVNKLSKDEAPPAKAASIDPNELVAITAAVEAFTQGKGRITNIEKIN